MIENADEDFNLHKLKNFRRKAVSLSPYALVRKSFLSPGATFPLLLEPAIENFNAVSWAASYRAEIEELLLAHGAVVFRNFGIRSAEQFAQFARAISTQLLDYNERAAPRIEVSRNVFTSTEYPPDLPIPLHHEMSYAHNWPMKIFFCCMTAAASGGATPIASDRLFFARLDPQIKETFIRKGVMYVRNYTNGFDLPWQEVFQTADKSVVEEYCREAGMEFEWKGDEHLQTRQRRPALATHPKTGETIWFNHAHMFHTSNLEPSLRQSLLAELREEELPRNSYYGDGSPIEASVLEAIRETYRELAVTIAWREGDVMLLDNMLASHGREPFTGTRKILVAMAERSPV